ncbi:ABC-2 type transport system ATP-binding protein [Caldalkalibacillus uzonensis]|uniref:ABC-2 type transport system ATP-binding protein n=1 Tax=Caldalkalibacillus uzonensis TaxID=353224 RepID=A0ABU0CNS0_9BACI|nr:ABC transporter ATP-binding protein [Caldalkalibacillus uzonensis]MDQ0337797.1 ABC-2 type transport system ATP-binding protein [Caldalkalibacillus uzonensis]
MEDMIRVFNLSKAYGELQAVKKVSFDVKKGEIFGLLGPNGAGKTTTLEMMEGLREPDEGEVLIKGISVQKDPGRVRSLIGVQLQSTSLFDLLKVEEILTLYASFYPQRLPVDTNLKQLNLEEKRHSLVKTLSGGQKQRLAIGIALIHDPLVVFLDEPTTGLDPQNRRSLWDIILALKAAGKTIILTTHYMEEAHVLCDRLAIMDRGQVKALGTPGALISSLEMESAVQFTCPRHQEDLSGLRGVTAVSTVNDQIILYTTRLQDTLTDLIRWADARGQTLINLETRQATLEDVFLHLTGRSLREE